ncbi:hypothetical protein [[Limnothrix rosea] IAM M-220]|uniref:hypothetical protein n=1 Tax=[Limnothrix rosea] IAM M-220 TaxID=454133 RepID=UPI000963A737|nr:hypothetical protein [[Limnothrix rosea] IAM M-220]OKH18442.1 hypothetical protein NIES208_05635 [[Limnothrix rosea] IAM M-220]
MARKKKLYQNKSYRDLQVENKINRNALSKKQQHQLKTEGYRNIGWAKVIQLYEKLKQINLLKSVEDVTLEELFIDADRIGNKYQTKKEIQDFQERLNQVNQEIADSVDKLFPDDDVEIFDFTGT